nr:hypothetical protein [uncultured bacterium]
MKSIAGRGFESLLGKVMTLPPFARTGRRKPVLSALGAAAAALALAGCAPGLDIDPLAPSDNNPGDMHAPPDGDGHDGASGPSDGDGSTPGDGNDGNGNGGPGNPVDNPPTGSIVPLFPEGGEMEPAVLEETASALITRFSDRARDRHAREDQYQKYEHYLHLYWEYRTAQVEIIDEVAKGGTKLTVNAKTLWKLDDQQAELRFFFRGIGTVAEYHDNGVMTPQDKYNYSRTVEFNARERRPLRVGDKIEFELSQFLDKNEPGFTGRDNYYGTTYLYIVGKGLVPWEGTGERRDSVEIPEKAWLGGRTTVHRNESNEPQNLFMQLATNMAPHNGQKFVQGRRVLHTSFIDGSHDESAENPTWVEQAGKAGPYFVSDSCDSCHRKNGRALAPEVGALLDKYVVKVGMPDGRPDPLLGEVLQPRSMAGAGEGTVSIARWVEEGGLRRPEYAFSGANPAAFSARVSPPLVGMGLLEAIPESAILALADENDSDNDGISGRPHVVSDKLTGQARLGRFGWKAGQPTVRAQTAAALRTDMGVLTSLYTTPDCGAQQSGCGPDGAELDEQQLDDLSHYVALLGVHAQRDYDAPEVVRGQQLFDEVGCASCHTATFQTSAYAKFAELRGQTIHLHRPLAPRHGSRSRRQSARGQRERRRVAYAAAVEHRAVGRCERGRRLPARRSRPHAERGHSVARRRGRSGQERVYGALRERQAGAARVPRVAVARVLARNGGPHATARRAARSRAASISALTSPGA